MGPIVLQRVSDRKPLVTIVSITYNHELYIRDCLEGFLLQKTDFPLEIIVHDDASTDHTADIIREYYKKRPDLFHVIIQRENQHSQHIPIWPQLFNMARGKYIALCEGDDYWTDPYKLQKQFVFMEENPEYSCCFHNTIIRSEKNGIESIRYKKSLKKDYSLKDIIAGGGGLMPTASMFFRAEKVRDFPKYKLNCPVGDYPLAICLAHKGMVRYQNDVMSLYRSDATNSWSDRMRKNKSSYEKTLKQSLEWLDNIEQSIGNHDALEIEKGHIEFLLVELSNQYSRIKNNKRIKSFLKQKSLLFRLKYYTLCNCPSLFDFLQKIKHIVPFFL